ncbi:Predicted secreted protein [Enterococcus casseliflavus]|nr:Predicted secreted protein [Enterococcus casseliflavus]
MATKYIGLKCKVLIKGVGATGQLQSLAGQRDATLNIDLGEIDVSSKDSEGGWEEVIPGSRSWNISCSGAHVPNGSAEVIEEAMLMTEHSVETGMLDAEITMPSGGNYKGKVLVTSFSKAMPHNDLVTYTLTLRGNGPLSRESTNASATNAAKKTTTKAEEEAKK